MSQSEARQRFGSVHLYWHGPDHCWDATPGRHRIVGRNRSNADRQAQREKPHSDWRDAMSEMLPGDAPVQASDIAASGAAAAANWLDRWIDVVQVVPSVQAERPSESATALPSPEQESSGIPHFVVILAFFAFLLIFATIEIMLRNNERQK